MHNLARYNEYFVLSLAVGKNDMMIQMSDKPNTTPIGQDRETLTFKALLYLDVSLYVLRDVYPIVQLGYPAITNIFEVNQIIRYKGVFALTKTPL